MFPVFVYLSNILILLCNLIMYCILKWSISRTFLYICTVLPHKFDKKNYIFPSGDSSEDEDYVDGRSRNLDLYDELGRTPPRLSMARCALGGWFISSLSARRNRKWSADRKNTREMEKRWAISDWFLWIGSIVLYIIWMNIWDFSFLNVY